MERVPIHLTLMYYQLNSSQIRLLQESIESYIEKLQWSTTLGYSPQDDLPNLVREIRELYQKALLIQEVSGEFNSGSYDLY